MIDIKCYMHDGANWQAQSILAYIRSISFFATDLAWNKEKHCSDAEIQVGRLENCREQGYVFTIMYNYKQIAHFWVYEHRNFDSICVVEFEGTFINTPHIDQVPMKDKHDYTKSFDYGKIVDCGDWIVNRMKELLSKAIEKQEDNDED